MAALIHNKGKEERRGGGERGGRCNGRATGPRRTQWEEQQSPTETAKQGRGEKAERGEDEQRMEGRAEEVTARQQGVWCASRS